MYSKLKYVLNIDVAVSALLCIIRTEQDSFNSITVAEIIKFPFKAQNPLTAKEHHNMATRVTTQIHKYYQIRLQISYQQRIITNQPALLNM
jgi:hypothetical protein